METQKIHRCLECPPTGCQGLLAPFPSSLEVLWFLWTHTPSWFPPGQHSILSCSKGSLLNLCNVHLPVHPAPTSYCVGLRLLSSLSCERELCHDCTKLLSVAVCSAGRALITPRAPPAPLSLLRFHSYLSFQGHLIVTTLWASYYFKIWLQVPQDFTPLQTISPRYHCLDFSSELSSDSVVGSWKSCRQDNVCTNL